VSQPRRTPREPSRITGTQIVVTAAGDIAEVVTDSCREAWGRWYAAESGSWSAWRHVPVRPEAIALALYTTPEQALVAVAGRAADARTFFLLTASGLVPIRLS
jgi:hypothetical protein